MNERYLTRYVKEDLSKKMVFLAGPRQVGKTTLAKFLLSEEDSYLNWDIAKHREKILKIELPDTPIWVFDEIHKYKDWRNFLKGVYDEFANHKEILVTGSAQLDYYRYGGDSLQGRYHYLRLFPLSVAELQIDSSAEMEDLLRFGGFPEPYYSASERFAKRWSREYRARLLEEDLMSLESVKDLGKLELLMLRLPELVASPLSINSLREDLQVSHKAVASWLDIFERLYAIFRISPFLENKLRAVKKEQKHYHFDWTLVLSEATRFENFIAMHLLKWVCFEQDVNGRNLDLAYFRDIDGREVDFVITENRAPIMAIECKLSDGDISKSLKYFKRKFTACEAIQVHLKGEKDYISAENIKVMPALKLLKKFC